MCSARGLLMFYISMKFHENILKGLSYRANTNAWQMDRQVRQKQYISTPVAET